MIQPTPDATDRRAERRALDKERLVFFSDAVFAIAITLLAIDVRLPPSPTPYDNASLVDALVAMTPDVFAFVLSFMVIALFWLGHYRTFRWTTEINQRLVMLNLVFLASVALLPFPTSVLAQEGNLTAATVFYAGYVLVTALLSTVLWVYAAQFAHLTAPAVTPTIARNVTIRALAVPAMFAVSIPVAFVSPFAADVIWFSSIAVQAVLTRRFHLERTAEPAPGRQERRHDADGATG